MSDNMIKIIEDSPELASYYASQFVQNEIHQNDGLTEDVTFQLQYKPVLPGTITGSVYWDQVLVQTFVNNMNGSFSFQNVGSPNYYVIEAGIDHTNGIITLQWNKPCVCSILVNYEYFPEEISWQPRKKVTNFVRPTFKQFFTSEELMEIGKSAGTVAAWDFNSALGDTIMEKYESLYIKCVEVTNVLIKKGAVGYFWIVGSPEITSIFETATVGFVPFDYHSKPNYHLDDPFSVMQDLGVAPMGLPQVTYRGAINRRWRIYADTEMPFNVMVFGCNDKRENGNHYARMTVANFAI